MAVQRPIDDIPASRPNGRPPTNKPVIIDKIAQLWFDQYLASGAAEYAPAIPGSRYRASNVAFRCDRQQYYALTDTERTDPDTIADIWRMNLGNLVHDYIGAVLDELGDGWRTELIVDLTAVGIDGSAHADMARMVCIHCEAPILMYVNVDDELATQIPCRCSQSCATSVEFEITRTAKHEHTWAPEHEKAHIVVELKTVNGMKWKSAATTFKGPPEGPTFAHVLQGAMSADAMGANNVVVAYLSMENVSPSMAKSYSSSEIGRFAGEWKYTVENLRPLLDAEYARINRLLVATDTKTLPARMLHDIDLPVGAYINNPSQSSWIVSEDGLVVDNGSTWLCNYCGWRKRCIADGADAVAVKVSI